MFEGVNTLLSHNVGGNGKARIHSFWSQRFFGGWHFSGFGKSIDSTDSSQGNTYCIPNAHRTLFSSCGVSHAANSVSRLQPTFSRSLLLLDRAADHKDYNLPFGNLWNVLDDKKQYCNSRDCLTMRFAFSASCACFSSSVCAVWTAETSAARRLSIPVSGLEASCHQS